MQQEQDARVFARVGADAGFVRWIKQQQDKEVAALIQQTDPVQLHRTQGRIATLQLLLKQIEAARAATSG